MTTRPYASARRVYWVTDNGSSHRGQPQPAGSKKPGCQADPEAEALA